MMLMPAARNELEGKRMEFKLGSAWGRLNPDSVLITAMGNHWGPTCWAKTVDMVSNTIKAGYSCGFVELMDRCLNPYDSLGTMRNEAILMAMNQGFEWLCYVDNDVQPDPDTLVKLLQWQIPVIGPFVVEPGTGHPVHGPALQPNTGLKTAKWTVLSMLLFRTDVFNCTGPMFWSDSIGADEAIHFQQLYHYGHRLFIDTNTQLVVGKRPLYPLSTKGLPTDQRVGHWEQARQKLLRPPDRRPLDPDSPLVQNEVYLPFNQPPEPPPEAPGSLASTGEEPKQGTDVQT